MIWLLFSQDYSNGFTSSSIITTNVIFFFHISQNNDMTMIWKDTMAAKSRARAIARLKVRVDLTQLQPQPWQLCLTNYLKTCKQKNGIFWHWLFDSFSTLLLVVSHSVAIITLSSRNTYWWDNHQLKWKIIGTIAINWQYDMISIKMNEQIMFSFLLYFEIPNCSDVWTSRKIAQSMSFIHVNGL